MPKEYRVVVVLSDGETWSELSGCAILVLPAGEFNELAKGNVKASDVEAVAEIQLEKIF